MFKILTQSRRGIVTCSEVFISRYTYDDGKFRIRGYPYGSHDENYCVTLGVYDTEELAKKIIADIYIKEHIIMP